jgi:hypothetical protein
MSYLNVNINGQQRQKWLPEPGHVFLRKWGGKGNPNAPAWKGEITTPDGKTYSLSLWAQPPKPMGDGRVLPEALKGPVTPYQAPQQTPQPPQNGGWQQAPQQTPQNGGWQQAPQQTPQPPQNGGWQQAPQQNGGFQGGGQCPVLGRCDGGWWETLLNDFIPY